MKKLWKALCVGAILAGCEWISVDNSAEGNYLLLFEYLSLDYAYKNEHDFTMEELKNRYIDELRSNPTEKKLAEIVVEIEKDLADPHFQAPDSVYELADRDALDYSLLKSESERDNAIPLYKDEIGLISENNYFAYGTVKSSPTIGYVYIKNLSESDGGIDRLGGSSWREEIEEILAELNGKGVETMIVDIRSRAGGSSSNPRYIANRFVNASSVYMIEEYEKDQNNYDSQSFSVEPEGSASFREGKIALLTNNLTCSGGEMLVLALLQRANVVHIGTPTNGCSGSIVDRDLYNGWKFRITASRTFRADGSSYFKTGIAPEITVKNNADYLVSRKDLVIERAIAELKK